MSKYSLRDVSAYGNILVNSPERLETFKETVANWQAKISIDMDIRIRGKFAVEAIAYCSKYANIRCEVGSKFLQWRIQSLIDVREINSKHIMIFLEDHQIVSNKQHFDQIIDSLQKEEIDIFQYSWFKHYAKARRFLEAKHAKNNTQVLSILVDKNSFRDFVLLNDTYIISLTSIFKKEALMFFLGTRRPWFRKYDSRGPFDVEKSPKQSFFLPIKYALPRSEFALCVDDEMGIPGSSAISRGISNSPLTKRGTNHYSMLSPKFWISKFRSESNQHSFKSNKLFHFLVKKPLSFFINFSNMLSNTALFLIFDLIDFKRRGEEN
jgi:hypothetical protein